MDHGNKEVDRSSSLALGYTHDLIDYKAFYCACRLTYTSICFDTTMSARELWNF